LFFYISLVKHEKSEEEVLTVSFGICTIESFDEENLVGENTISTL